MSAPSKAPSKPQVPSGWLAKWDERYREWYYVDLSTGKSQWDAPEGTTSDIGPPEGLPTPHSDARHSPYPPQQYQQPAPQPYYQQPLPQQYYQQPQQQPQRPVVIQNYTNGGGGYGGGYGPYGRGYGDGYGGFGMGSMALGVGGGLLGGMLLGEALDAGHDTTIIDNNNFYDGSDMMDGGGW